MTEQQTRELTRFFRRLDHNKTNMILEIPEGGYGLHEMVFLLDDDVKLFAFYDKSSTGYFKFHAWDLFGTNSMDITVLYEVKAILDRLEDLAEELPYIIRLGEENDASTD
jgi:hypothetical protein